MSKFSVGDKIIYMRPPTVGSDFAQSTGIELDLGSVYTVKDIDDKGNEEYIELEETSKTWWIHESQFDRAKITNEQRIAQRREQCTTSR